MLAWERNLSVQDFARRLHLEDGVTGYIYHTVPVSLYAYLRHQENFEDGLIAAISCGGDTDTVGAITGALLGARSGLNGMPAEWKDRLIEWPRSSKVLIATAERLDQQTRSGSMLGPISYFWPALLLRNFLFLIIVLGHGLRRLVPPY
jgi:ADP-ribosyl-[dinitrogen reductase] hydrolase